MPKFLVEVWLDGYETEEAMEEACEEFIEEQLNMTASSVTVTRLPDDFVYKTPYLEYRYMNNAE